MFELSQDHEDFRKVVRDFAEREVAAARRAVGPGPPLPGRPRPQDGRPRAVRPRRARRSSAAASREGGDFTSLCVAIEELGRVDQSIGITLSAGVGLGINPILTYGTDEQKQRWLPDLVAGRALAGFGLTEPDAGSDAGATRTKAVRDGDEWVVDGAKAFITNSGTDITSRRHGHRPHRHRRQGLPQISAIMVPAGTPGFTVEPAYDKLGWHISDTHGLTFEGCRVPGGQPARRARDRASGSSSRPSTTAASRSPRSPSGLAQALLDESTDYAKTRTAFGRPIGANQGVAFQIADLAVRSRPPAC